jgi:hypothetical protein
LASVLQVDQTNEFALLATAKHERRQQLLSLILEHDGSDALRQAFEALDALNEEEPGPPIRVGLPTPTGYPAQPNQPQTISASPNPNESPVPATEQPFLPENVSSEQLEHLPKPVQTVAFRVRCEKIGREHTQHVRQVTDSARCEKVVMLYEIEQGRFPYLVSWMQGKQALGCDLISFSSEADRSEFEELRQRGILGNSDRAIRFIEAKGRGISSGAVPLEGNELKAAKQRTKLYFIYRIYEAVEGQEWHLLILQNPLAYDWPISYSVDPSKREEAEFWSVKAMNPNKIT